MDEITFLSLIDNGDTGSVSALLQKEPALLALRDRLGWTPLHRAVSRGDAAMARVLLDSGAELDAVDRRNETPLFFAVGHNPELVELLLEAGADANHPNSLGDTPLFAAGDEDACEQARLLIQRGAQVNAHNESGQTALHAAAASGSCQVVEVLLENGAEVDARDIQGKTPLHWAVYGNIMPHRLQDHLKTIELLLSSGADGQAHTQTGESVLELARRHWGFPEIVVLLTSRGVHPDDQPA